MAKKQMYIYRLEAGYSYKEDPEITEFFYATNSKRLIQYAQNLYRDKKYNKFTTIKVGIMKEPTEMRRISEFERWYLKQYVTADFYSERIEP